MKNQEQEQQSSSSLATETETVEPIADGTAHGEKGVEPSTKDNKQGHEDWIPGARLGPFSVAEPIEPGSLTVVQCFTFRQETNHLVRFNPPGGLVFAHHNQTETGYIDFEIRRGKIDPRKLPEVSCRTVAGDEEERNAFLAKAQQEFYQTQQKYYEGQKQSSQNARVRAAVSPRGVALNSSQLSFLLLVLSAGVYYLYSLPWVRRRQWLPVGGTEKKNQQQNHPRRRKNKGGKGGFSRSKKGNGKQLSRSAGAGTKFKRVGPRASLDDDSNKIEEDDGENRDDAIGSDSVSPSDTFSGSSADASDSEERTAKTDRQNATATPAAALKNALDSSTGSTVQSIKLTNKEENDGGDDTNTVEKIPADGVGARDTEIGDHMTTPKETRVDGEQPEHHAEAPKEVPDGSDENGNTDNYTKREQDDLEKPEKMKPDTETMSSNSDTKIDLRSEELTCMEADIGNSNRKGNKDESITDEGTAITEETTMEVNLVGKDSIPTMIHSTPPASATTESVSSSSSFSKHKNIVVLLIDGMTCGGCVKVVNKVLNSFDEVDSAVTDLKTSTSTLTCNVRRLNLLPILTALDEVGMEAYLQSQSIAPVKSSNKSNGGDAADFLRETTEATAATTAAGTLSTTTCPEEDQRNRQSTLGAIERPLLAKRAPTQTTTLSLMDELRVGSTPLRRYQCSCGCEGCICSDKQVHADDQGTDISLTDLCNRLETTLGTTKLEESFRETGGSPELRDKILHLSFPCGCSDMKED